MIVANDLSDPTIGMESDENAVTIFSRNREIEKISRASKKIIARDTREKNLRKREKSFDKKFLRMNESVSEVAQTLHRPTAIAD